MAGTPADGRSIARNGSAGRGWTVGVDSPGAWSSCINSSRSRCRPTSRIPWHESSSDSGSSVPALTEPPSTVLDRLRKCLERRRLGGLLRRPARSAGGPPTLRRLQERTRQRRSRSNRHTPEGSRPHGTRWHTTCNPERHTAHRPRVPSRRGSGSTRTAGDAWDRSSTGSRGAGRVWRGAAEDGWKAAAKSRARRPFEGERGERRLRERGRRFFGR